MEKLFERNYEATKKRGLITSKTELIEFLMKINEEVKEVESSYDSELQTVDPMELVDLMSVCDSTLKFMGYKTMDVLVKVVEKNESRAKTAELKNALNYADKLLSNSTCANADLLNCISVLVKNVAL